MSQKKVNQHKNEKSKRKELKKRKDFHKMLWICAGCIIVGITLGYLLGKFWLYPDYRASKNESVYSQSMQDSTGLDSQDLQELNRQMEEGQEAEE